MKKRKLFAGFLLLLTGLWATAAWAGGVWASKAWTDWSDRDIAKILTDSPWARGASTIPVFVRFPILTSPTTPGGAEIASGPGALGIGGPSVPPPTTEVRRPSFQVAVVVRWQSSLVIQQALVKAQYGDKAATSPEAQKRLQPNSAYYVIAVANLPEGFEAVGPAAKAAQLAATNLTIKDKNPIVAQDLLFIQNGAGASEVRFLFRRSVLFTVGDKYADFATRFGKLSVVKVRFVSKDMLVGGELQL
ncbi:MAG TPA: hypothetical protein VN519_15695 [Bryobacteraceae bacterium]|nr:hypothetical protein [Bryobacteraceae bacterium]